MSNRTLYRNECRGWPARHATEVDERAGSAGPRRNYLLLVTSWTVNAFRGEEEGGVRHGRELRACEASARGKHEKGVWTVASSRVEKILVIIPAYNEQGAIRHVVTGSKRAVPEADVLVINDGSVDATMVEAEKAGALVVDHPFNLGIGGAVQTGLKFARCIATTT